MQYSATAGGCWWYQCFCGGAVAADNTALDGAAYGSRACNYSAGMVIAGFCSGAHIVYWLFCSGSVKVVVLCAILSGWLVKKIFAICT